MNRKRNNVVLCTKSFIDAKVYEVYMPTASKNLNLNLNVVQLLLSTEVCVNSHRIHLGRGLFEKIYVYKDYYFLNWELIKIYRDSHSCIRCCDLNLIVQE